MSVRAVPLVLLLLAVACGPPRDRGDNGGGRDTDAGNQLDAGETSDAGQELDGGEEPDAGEPSDGGEESDGGEPSDGGEEPDGGDEPDPGVDPDVTAAQLAALHAANVGPVTLPVEGATVTYVREALGDDKAGFFIQATREGPAIFVEIAPSQLTPPPSRGNRVDFVAKSIGIAEGLRRVTGLEEWFVAGTGDVPGLVQDVTSKVDLVSALGDYESELIRLEATVREPFAGAGPGHVSAAIDTAGVQANNNLKVRLPATVRDAIDLEEGCEFTIESAPMWRYFTQAQPSPGRVEDLKVQFCPTPRVAGARAEGLNTVVVELSRRVDPSSVTTPALQFTFDGGLVATAATVEGNEIIVTTTPQEPGRPYTVTVTNVRDQRGAFIVTGDDTATFKGWLPLAQLAITEVNHKQSAGRDLVELTAVSAGHTEGLQLQLDILVPRTSIATLPRLVVEKNDVIVVHLAANGPFNGPGTETLAKDQYPADQYPANYDGAWDIHGSGTGIADRHRVMFLTTAQGDVMDAIAFVSASNTASPPERFPEDLRAIQSLGLWSPSDCGGVPCGYETVPSAVDVGANWSPVQNSLDGNSLRRTPPFTRPSSAGQWTVGEESFGVLNF